MLKTKQEWLFQLRKCATQDTLDNVIEKNSYELTGEELLNFFGAADHRLAEIITNKLYDKVPAPVWSRVR